MTSSKRGTLKSRWPKSSEEALALRLIFERVQEHRLAHAAEAPHDHALLGRPALEPSDHDLELAKLEVAPGKLRGVETRRRATTKTSARSDRPERSGG